VLALTILVAGVAVVSAHRRDEYLQAARLALAPGRVQIELDLTPGIAVTDAILVDIDGDRNETLSAEEQHAYGSLVMGALDLEVDGTRLPVQLTAYSFPAVEAMRRGEGTIRLQLAALLPPLPVGSHHLLFRNRHLMDRSVYLANALMPDSDQVVVTGQRRDGNQRALTIDYVLRAEPATSSPAWLLGGIGAAMALAIARTIRR
jgi:hypothetical protein